MLRWKRASAHPAGSGAGGCRASTRLAIAVVRAVDSVRRPAGSWRPAPDESGSVQDERGSAALEFLSLGVLLLVPMVYLVLAMSAIQGAELSSQGAVRQAARVFADAPDAATGRARAAEAVRFALADFHIDAAAAHVRITCRPHPDRCLDPGGSVTVAIRTDAALPLIPDLGPHRAVVPIHAAAVQPVSRFRAPAAPDGPPAGDGPRAAGGGR